jgi:hypothetical protein
VGLTEPIGDAVAAKFERGAYVTVSEHGFYRQDRRSKVGRWNSLAETVRAQMQKRLLADAPAAKGVPAGRRLQSRKA